MNSSTIIPAGEIPSPSKLTSALESWRGLIIGVSALLAFGWSAHAYVGVSHTDFIALKDAITMQPPVKERVVATEKAIAEMRTKQDFTICAILQMSADKPVEPCRYLLPDNLNKEIDQISGR